MHFFEKVVDLLHLINLILVLLFPCYLVFFVIRIGQAFKQGPVAVLSLFTFVVYVILVLIFPILLPSFLKFNAWLPQAEGIGNLRSIYFAQTSY
jgi:glucan phosphoethanolaminetransferase (alkaline phosphatase superfamily)